MKTHKQPAAFTLIELLVGITMIIMIVAAIYSSYVAVAQSDLRYRQRLSITRHAGRALAQMTVLLQGSYLPKQSGADPNRIERTGPVKTAPIPRFESPRMGSGGVLLHWVTTYCWDDDCVDSGLWVTTLRWDRSRRHVLIKQIPFVWGQAATPSEEEWGVVCEQIESIELTFYDQGQWHQAWKQDHTRGLPEQVRIELTIQGDHSQALEFFATAGILGPTTKAGVL